MIEVHGSSFQNALSLVELSGDTRGCAIFLIDETPADQHKPIRRYLASDPTCAIDPVLPLTRGGADVPGNIQWQAKEEAKQKDRRE